MLPDALWDVPTDTLHDQATDHGPDKPDTLEITEETKAEIHIDTQSDLETVCTPACQDHECGEDGCGGQCGSCQPGFLCVVEAGGTSCQPDCPTLCAGLECGTPAEAETCVCGSCTSADVCQEAVCQQGKCELTDNSAACDDGNPCTGPDVCTLGNCLGTLLPADQLAQLNCVCVDDASCASLDDGDSCDGILKCLAVGNTKVCIKEAGSEKNCDDGLACTLDTCSDSFCGHELQPYFCVIPDLGCVPSLSASEQNACLRCVTESNPVGWTGSEDGVPCGTGGVCYNRECCDRAAHCSGLQCGDDGCGGTCGTCSQGSTCQNGQCTTGPCVPQCSGKQCGFDGCTGTCGTCPANNACLANGTCLCVPQCTGKTCGDNGCGGTCGTCAVGSTCTAGACITGPCNPQCSGKQCGPDGCNGTCGTCPANSVCLANGLCLCLGQCYGKQCGDDGCGGLCGTCSTGATCTNGQCLTGPCSPSCAGKQCGSDGCGGLCGVCAVGSWCNSGKCQEAVGTGSCVGHCGGSAGDCYCDDLCGLFGICCNDICAACPSAVVCKCGNGVCDLGESCRLCPADCGCPAGKTCYGDTCCTPSCGGKQCGPDGCGGSCGTCAVDQACDALGTCTCVPNCAGKNCGSDGCGGTCGSCTDTDSLACTSAACIDGFCDRSVSPFFCVIEETCLPSGTENPTTSCQKCLPATNAWDWSPVATGTSCGTGLTCHGGQCCPYDCTGKNCGPDGCGSTCGECALGNDACYNGLCGNCGDGNSVDWDGCTNSQITEFRVNTHTAGSQSKPSVAVGADGRVLFVWYNESVEGPGQGIVGALYDPTTGTITPETLYFPARNVSSVIAKPGGGYVLGIGCNASQTGGFLIALDPDGAPVGEPISFDTGTPTAVELSGGAETTFILTTALGIGGVSIGHLRRFSFDLTDLGYSLSAWPNSCDYKERYPMVSMFPDGAYLFTWKGSCQSNGYSSYNYTAGCSADNKLLSDGGNDFGISAGGGLGTRGGVAALAGGYGILIYRGSGLQGIMLSQNGVHLSDPLTLSDASVPITIDYDGPLRTASLADGTAVAAWTGQTAAEPMGVFLRKVGLKGFSNIQTFGPERQANSYTLGNQWDPMLGASKQGWFVVVWNSDGQDGSSAGIYARRYAMDGTELPRKDVP